MSTITPNPGSPLWPADWQGCHITGRFIDSMGNPVVGSVVFKPSVPAVLDFNGKVVILGSNVPVALDANGAFDVVLPATDDPDTSPNGWTYSVTESFPGGRSYSINAPMNTDVDLSLVSPVPDSSGTAIVRGPQGDQGIQGIQGPQGTPGEVQRFQASHAYPAGYPAVDPNGNLVTAKVAFTSAAAYNAADWNPSKTTSDLASHTAATSTHGVTGAIVGTTDTQTLTNKTLSGASNTFSGIPSAAVTGLDTHTAATAAHGASGAVVGTTNTQALTNKDLSSGTNTFPPALATLTGAQTLTNKTLTSPTVQNSTTTTTATTTVPQVVKGIASQTADLQQWQNSAGTVLVKVDASGNVTSSGTITSQGYLNEGANRVFSAANPPAKANLPGTTAYTDAANAFTKAVSVTADAAATIPLIAKGFAAQTGDLQQWQDSTGAVKAKVDASGVLTAAGLSTAGNINVTGGGTHAIVGNITETGQTVSQPSTAAQVPQVMKGVASQTGDLTQWQDSTGAVLAKLTSTGYLYVNMIYSANGGSLIRLDLGPSATVVSRGDTQVALAAKANSTTSTADLQQWQNSAGTALAKVDANGNLSANDVQQSGRSLPWGMLSGGLSSLTANTSVNATTTATDSGLTFTVTLVTGRRYKVTFDGLVSSSVAADRATLIVYNATGAATLKTAQGPALATAGSGQSHSLTWQFTCPGTLAAGSTQFKLQLQRLSGTGVINLAASAATPAQFWIEDIGPNT